jgi:hypothetical protein
LPDRRIAEKQKAQSRELGFLLESYGGGTCLQFGQPSRSALNNVELLDLDAELFFDPDEIRSAYLLTEVTQPAKLKLGGSAEFSATRSAF